jgi:hypothetical protein
VVVLRHAEPRKRIAGVVCVGMSSASQSVAVASKRRSGIRQRTSLVCPEAPRPCSGSRTGCILSDPRDGREWTATSAGVMRRTGCHPERTGSVASTRLPSGCNTHPPACSSSPQTLPLARIAGRPARTEASGNSCTCVRRNLSRCTSALRRVSALTWGSCPQAGLECISMLGHRTHTPHAPRSRDSRRCRLQKTGLASVSLDVVR